MKTSQNPWPQVAMALLCLAVLLALPPAARAQDGKPATPSGIQLTPPEDTKAKDGAARPASPEESVEMVQLTFPENLEVRLLITYVSQRLGINFLYDEAIGKKRVTLLTPTKIPKDSLMGLLESVLRMTGLAIVDADQPGWKRIIPATNLLDRTKDFQEDPQKLRTADDQAVISQVFRLESVPLSNVQQAINPFLSKPGGNIFTIPSRNLLVVTDYAGNLKRAAAVIALMDRPGRQATIRFLPVEHTVASELAKQVAELLKERDALSGAAPAKGAAAGEALSIKAEPRSNQIVLISTGERDKEVLELIQALDTPESGETKTYRFEHVTPQRIDQLAKELVGEQMRRQFRSTIDEESGLYVVTAPPAAHQQITTLAKELDTPATEAEFSSVQFYKLVNTTAASVLATIRAIDTDGQGLAELARQATQIGVRDPATGRFTGPNTPPPGVGKELPKPPSHTSGRIKGKTPAKGAAASSRLPTMTAKTQDATVTADPNTNTLIVVAPPPVQRIYKQLIAVLDKRRPQVMIEVTLVTLDTSGDFSLGVELSRAGGAGGTRRYLVFNSFGLSEPDTETGSLAIKPGVGFNGALVGIDTINVVLRALRSSGRSKVVSAPRVLVNDNATATLSSVSESPFTSINSSDTVATTSFAGYAEAGTTLTVTPHISEGEHLNLNYSVTLNSFTGEGSGGIPPPRQTNTLSSEVTVPDGYTVIVGGLTSKTQSETSAVVPWLGEQEWLKYILGSHSNNQAQSTLFAFIRPIILRDDEFEDLKFLSEREVKAAEMPADLPSGEPLIMK